MAEQRTVVITGSTGRIGAILRHAFAGRYRLRGIDRIPTPGAPDALPASLTELQAILPAFKVSPEDATYQERAFQEPARGHEGIRRYWQEKVVTGQARIQFALLHLYLDGVTAIAEWEAEFDDLPANVRRRMREVTILEFREGRIASLREYWYAIIAGK